MTQTRLFLSAVAVSLLSLGASAAAVEVAVDGGSEPQPTAAIKIMVVIPEWHISHWIPDPAAETAIIGALVDAGYRVVDQMTAAEVRADEQLRQRVLGDPHAAAEIGLQYNADVIITGEAFSEDAGRVAGMRSCRARVEIRAVRCRTAEVIAALSAEASGADIAEAIAAKKALRNAGNRAYGELAPRLASSEERPTQHPIMVTVTGVDFDALAELQSLISTLPEVIEVVRPQLLGSTGSLEIIASAEGSDIASAMSGVAIAGETLNIEAASSERISCTLGASSGAVSLSIGGLAFKEATQIRDALEEHSGPKNVQLIKFVEGRALYHVGGTSSAIELVDWLTTAAKIETSLKVISVEANSASLEAAAGE